MYLDAAEAVDVHSGDVCTSLKWGHSCMIRRRVHNRNCEDKCKRHHQECWGGCS